MNGVGSLPFDAGDVCVQDGFKIFHVFLHPFELPLQEFDDLAFVDRSVFFDDQHSIVADSENVSHFVLGEGVTSVSGTHGFLSWLVFGAFLFPGTLLWQAGDRR